MTPDVFQAIGAVAGGLAILAGGIWGIAQLFLYGRLTRQFVVKLGPCQFAATDKSTVLVEATFANESRSTTRVMGIYFRPELPLDGSSEAREIERRTREWRYLGAGPETLWRPSESLQAVFEVEWPADRLAIPLHFKLLYRESITELGPLATIRHLLLVEPGRKRELTVYRLLTHPFIKSIKEEGAAV